MRSAPPAHGLPAPSTPLIGREEECATARKRLLDPHVRLLTFTGPPGIGKTRLAIAAAEAVSRWFPDGVFFVDLAPISDPALVVPAIAEHLRVKEAGDQAVLELVKHDVRDKCLLLVLDNVEQVTDAAPDIADLLAACPKMKIIATSRAALRLSWEHEFPIPPLRLPDLTTLPVLTGLLGYPAIALFVDRATAVHPDFSLSDGSGPSVARICARLEGIPLVIKLAAARAKVLSPHAILDRLHPPTRRRALTERELSVASLIAKGMTNREIATALFITPRTAATHVQHILNKLGFTWRSQIAAWAVARRLPAASPGPP